MRPDLPFHSGAVVLGMENIRAAIIKQLNPHLSRILLREEADDLGSEAEVSSCLDRLVNDGRLMAIGRDIYWMRSLANECGSCGNRASGSASDLRELPNDATHSTPSRVPAMRIAEAVFRLSEATGVSAERLFMDEWADAVTSLAGDDVLVDETEELLVALARAHKISPQQLIRLAVAHRREARGV